MTILPIVLSPDPRLKQVSKPVKDITDETLCLIDDMFDTMYAAKGVGLSAVQVGVMQRVITIDVEQLDEQRSGERGNPIAMINPEIITQSAEQNTYAEGCLSFPAQYSDVTRPKTVTIRYTNRDGELQEIEADELLATCVQHEIDHMNGIVFVDHISRLKRDMIAKKLVKLKKQGELNNEIYDI